MFSFRYCKDLTNWLFIILLACLAMHTQSDICRQKINFIPHAFMDILHRYANLFWALWACLVTLTQNDSIALQKTSMFICMQKINFVIHLFITILHFEDSCNLIGWQHFGPKLETKNFSRCLGEISKTILVLILNWIPRKTKITKFFKKSKIAFWPHSGPFLL